MNITLDGGVTEDDENPGRYKVLCWFAGFPTEHDAQHVSDWLEALIMQHVHEISEETKQ